MGIVSSAKLDRYDAADLYDKEFQSPMGIVSSAKLIPQINIVVAVPVSIPDGDSFLREVFRVHWRGFFWVGFNPRWG